MVLLQVFAGLLLTTPLCSAAAPIIAATSNERITIKQKDVEINVPIPAGYTLIDHRRVHYTRLPEIQARKPIAAFAKPINAGNEYSITAEPDQSEPVHYLVYTPKLDGGIRLGEDPLSQLEEIYSQRGFEQVSDSQRYALLRTADNALSVTWVDFTPYAVAQETGVATSAVNCINTVAYVKDGVLLMFDTIEACGIDAPSVKAHGEAWLRKIRLANEPLSYAQKLLAERESSEEQEAEAGEAEVPNADKQAVVGEVSEAPEETASLSSSDDDDSHVGLILLYVVLGIFLGVIATLLFGWRAKR